MSLGEKSLARLSIELTAASFAVLFGELALIRWLPGQIRVLAYFPNLILLAAFLGLGLGALRSGARPLFWTWPVSLLAVALAGLGLRRVVFTQDSASEHLFLLYYDLPKDAPVLHDIRLPIVVAFLLGVASFLALGQVVGERLDEFRARSAPLRGYGWDIAGSLAGVVAFSVASFTEAPPAAWFLVVLAAGLIVLPGQWRLRALYGAASVAVLLIVWKAQPAERFSPYYAITVDRRPERPGFAVLVNGSLHQYAFGVAGDEDSLTEAFRAAREGYRFPYRHLQRPVGRALVVGAGTGNDVAVLLSQGALRVDAVEIDPVILELGQRLHPDRPYDSPRVRVFNTDARSFLNGSAEEYDLIVFGTLDSMTRLSALSNVRLDNFVYTLECVRTARGLLAPGGGLVMYSMVGAEYIDLRLYGMLTDAFGEAPVVSSTDYGLFNRIYMAGPAFGRARPAEETTAASVLGRLRQSVELPSDDWPYLYLRRRGISFFYLGLMTAFCGLAVLAVSAASREVRRSLGSGEGIDLEMFLFGLGFLLLETRSVTEMNLVWGATWLTSAVVFGSILGMVLLATLLAQWRPLPYGVAMAGLLLSLLAAYAVPARLLLGSHAALKLGLSALFVGGPVFFAASCFALLFRDRRASGAAFGWNLLGAVAGGLLEFASMAVGLKALLLVAAAAYMLALLLRLRRGERPAAAA